MNIQRCPICKDHVSTVVSSFRGHGELAAVKRIAARNPSWNRNEGLCERCLYLNEFDTVEEHFSSLEAGTLFRLRLKNEFALLPTRLRINADPRFTGKGITIAFLDSGFYPHPDLVKPVRRIKAIIDVTDERKRESYFSTPHPESWHGTMTSVAAAGNGRLSRGVFRGIASEAGVVLIKVMDTRTGHISADNIARGIRWAREHKDDYGIRIISISVGDDQPVHSAESTIDREAKEAVKAGIVVVAAIGNSPGKAIVPPASSPSVITVGGLDDGNTLHRRVHKMYHSTFGTTIDGIRKPELIAPAIWVAGPILPRTDQYRESKALFDLLKATSKTIEKTFIQRRAMLPTAPRGTRRSKEWIRKRILAMKYIAPYYKHVDGTSFAAPIVSSVIAQMLEAMPELSPARVKQILTQTAEPLANVSHDQQGFGVPNPRAAVAQALRDRHANKNGGVHLANDMVYFIYHNRMPRSVSLAGDFNNWNSSRNGMHESDPGTWSCWIPRPSPGNYGYKFVVDETVWLEDPANKERVPDGFGGWNSRFVIAE